MFSMNVKNLGMWLVIALVGLWLAGLFGCAGPGMLSGMTNDIKGLLADPTVQATLQSWSARTDITNPRASGVLINGFELRLDGVISRGQMTGSGVPGVDAELLATLQEMASAYRAAQPSAASQPSGPDP